MEQHTAEKIAAAVNEGRTESDPAAVVWDLAGGFYGVAIDTDTTPRGSVLYALIGSDDDGELGVWFEDSEGELNPATGEETDFPLMAAVHEDETEAAAALLAEAAVTVAYPDTIREGALVKLSGTKYVDGTVRVLSVHFASRHAWVEYPDNRSAAPVMVRLDALAVDAD